MDTKTLITKLQGFFCDISKRGKVYSKVWLDEADFGGLYHSGKYILNVKAHNKIDNIYSEIKDIFYLLDEKAKEELPYIWRVAVYRTNEKVYCSDLVVYESENACM